MNDQQVIERVRKVFHDCAEIRQQEIVIDTVIGITIYMFDDTNVFRRVARIGVALQQESNKNVIAMPEGRG